MAEIFFRDPFSRLLLNRPIIREWPGYASFPMDWLETPSAHIIRINIPGLGRDDVKIQLGEGHVLEIKGEAKEKEEEVKDAEWHVRERVTGEAKLERRLALPEHVKADMIKAHVENGVLTVVVPKEPVPAKPKPRPIPVSSKL